MSSITKRFAVVAAAVMLTAAASAHATMYGVTAGEGTNELLRVDETTGAGTSVGDAPMSLSGASFTSSGRLYVTTGSGESNLLELDPETAAVLSSKPIRVGNVGGGVADIAFQPGTDVLYGITANLNPYFGLGAGAGGYLLKIDLATGNATVVGRDAQFGNEQGAIAFAPDGTLYFTPGQNTIGSLYRLDPATAAVLGSVTLAPSNGFMGLAVRPSDGLLFGCGPAGFGSSDSIFTVDAGTGAVTEIGEANTLLKVHDLAFAPPRAAAPAMARGTLVVGIILLGAAGTRRLRRRRRHI